MQNEASGRLQGVYFSPPLSSATSAHLWVSVSVMEGGGEREREKWEFFLLFFSPPALLFQHKADSVRAVRSTAANEAHAEASHAVALGRHKRPTLMFNRFTATEASCDRCLKRTNAFATFCYVCALDPPCRYDTAPPSASAANRLGKCLQFEKNLEEWHGLNGRQSERTQRAAPGTRHFVGKN